MAKNRTKAPPEPTTTVLVLVLDAKQQLATTHTAEDTTTPSDSAARTRGAVVGLADQVGDAVADTARDVRTVLADRVPTYLGACALVLVGVIDPLAALVGGLAYEAFRRWTPQRQPG